MALFDSYEFLCLLPQSENMNLKRFIKFERHFFMFSTFSSDPVTAERGIFHKDRYSISVAAVLFIDVLQAQSRAR